MQDEIKELLRKVISEITDNGEDMGALLKNREDVVYWLRQSVRHAEADIIKACEPFELRGTDDGLVRVEAGPGFLDRFNLVDFKRDG